MLPPIFPQDPSAEAPQVAESLEPGGAEPGADPGAAPKANPFVGLMPILFIGVIFWLLILGPERKARRRQEEMRKALKKGDEVMTGGGIYGRVTRIDGDVVTLQVADGVRMRFARSAVQGRVGDEPQGGRGKAQPEAPTEALPEAEPEKEEAKA